MKRIAPVIAAFLLAACEGRNGAGSGSGALPVATTGTGVEMVLIPAGEFRMGGRGKGDEAPVHAVRVDAFWMDRREVTQAEYEKLGFPNPSKFKGADLPVEMMTWTKAVLFANARSRADNLEPCYDEDTAECNFAASGYRLPTEAEWEYACRAGSDAEYSFGGDPRRLPEAAWFRDNSSKKTHPVGKKAPNRWGLHDLHGNVAEWCNDVYDEVWYSKSSAENPRGSAEGKLYVVRGGSWRSSAAACRSAARAGDLPGFSDSCLAPDTLGLRLVRRGTPAAPGAAKSAEAKAAPERGSEAKAPKTGFIIRDAFLEHRTGEGFPERPERLRAIVRRFEERGLLRELASIGPKADPTEWIAKIHSAEYIERVRKACGALGERIGTLDSGDVPISSGSWKAAVAAVGAVLDAVDAVMAGEVRNCFCAVRPPGHHALMDKAMGFCIFGNVAIAARYLREKHRLARVLIVDWDVHHGNGTQAAFESDPSVFYFSTHRSPYYPGTGAESERGTGAGAGTKLNVPLAAGSGDAEIERAWIEKLEPAAAAFNPEFVLVSAGFDAHRGDPLGGLEVTAEGYARLTRRVKAIAERSCGGRLVSVLEGGYDLEGLADATEAHVRALME